MGRGAVTPNPDPQKRGTVPVIGAVDADLRTTTLFNAALDDGVSITGIEARLTCYDDSLVLKSFDLDGTGTPEVSEVLPMQLRLNFDAGTGDDPDYEVPTLELIDTGNMVDADGNPVAPGIYGLIDIDA